MGNINKALPFFSMLAGMIAVLLVLYAYPYAGIDPVDAYPFYAHPLYLRVCVPYAALFLVLSISVFIKKSRIATLILLAAFLVSHAHMKWIFPEIKIKPVFTAVFIVIPTLVFLITTVALWRQKS